MIGEEHEPGMVAISRSDLSNKELGGSVLTPLVCMQASQIAHHSLGGSSWGCDIEIV